MAESKADNPPAGLTAKRKVCLIAIDGWGLSEETKGNAAAAAATPVVDKFYADSKSGGECAWDSARCLVRLRGVCGVPESGVAACCQCPRRRPRSRGASVRGLCFFFVLFALSCLLSLQVAS